MARALSGMTTPGNHPHDRQYAPPSAKSAIPDRGRPMNVHGRWIYYLRPDVIAFLEANRHDPAE
jgi:hypothetical protein